MGGPWDKYAAPPDNGPWTKYAAPAETKAASTLQASPSAGQSWYERLGQGIENVAKSAAVPYLELSSALVPSGAAMAQQDIRDLTKNAGGVSQFVGQTLGGIPLAVAAGAAAEPLAAGAAETLAPMAGTSALAPGVQAARAAATAIGGGAALGAGTTAPGERGTGALLGAATGAIPSALYGVKGAIGKLFAPGVADKEAAAAVEAAQKSGFIVPPSEVTGAPQVAREVSGSFGPFAKKVPEQNIQTFAKRVFKTLGMPSETTLTNDSVSRAMGKVARDFKQQIGKTTLTMDQETARLVDNAITQNKAMAAEFASNPASKGVAAAIHRAQEGEPITAEDFYTVSQWLRDKSFSTSDGATQDALKNLEQAWMNGASGNVQRVTRALRLYRTRMSQAMDLRSMMHDPATAAGVKPIDPTALYKQMSRNKPSVASGASPYAIAPLAQQASVTRAFGTGSRIPGWAERAATLEGIGALGSGKARLPYMGTLTLPQTAIFGTAGAISRSVLKQLATPEGQQMLLHGYQLSPQDLQRLARLGLLGGTTAASALPISDK